MHNYGYDEDGSAKSIGDLGLWRRIVRYLQGHLASFTVAVVLSLLVTGATLAQPWLLQQGIDHYITAAHLAKATRFSGLASIAFWYALMVVAVFLLSFVQVVLLEYLGQSIMHAIRQDLFAHLLRLDLPFFGANPTGRLVTRLTNDIQNMHEMFTSVMVTLFNDLLKMVGILIVLFVMNLRLALLMSLFVPVALAGTVLFARLAREKFRAIRIQLAKINSYLSEAISGIAILQLFGRTESSRNEFAALNDGFLARTLSQIRLFGAFMPLTELMSSAALALILWYGGGEILRQRMSLGELVAFISYMRLFFQPLRELAQKYSIVQSAMASAERIFLLLDTRSTIQAPQLEAPMGDGGGTLVFHRVSFGYEPEKPVVHDIDFALRPGQTVALVGTTGSGKTTLVNLLLRFYDPQQGTISIDGVDIGEYPLQQLRTVVGVVLQDVLILQDSLLANIVMDTGRKRAEVMDILERTGMQRFVDKLPQGLDTIIGEGGQELSTGEKQLLSFARMLCRDPRILVLDEATAAIDTESENILEAALADVFTDRTSLIIAHRLSTIRRADHILVMQRGRIVEQGSHQQLLQQQGPYAALVAMDLENGNDD